MKAISELPQLQWMGYRPVLFGGVVKGEDVLERDLGLEVMRRASIRPPSLLALSRRNLTS
jgi:hypothetical protein